MMKQLAVWIFSLSFLLPLTGWSEEGTAEKIEVTIVGEVVNPICYLAHNGKGEEHKSCAVSSNKAGLPLAILEDDTEFLYLAITPDHQPADGQLSSFLAQRVQVQGKLMEGNGVTIIEVEKVNPV